MALKSTIYKADLNISDMDRGYYADHSLTIARHPSETDERMMIRVLAFAIHASEKLSFGKGISDTEEPDLWEKDYTDAIQLWVEVGQPDDRRLLKACGRSEQVVAYSYASTSDIWWKQMNSRLDRAKNLKVMNVPAATSQALAKLAQRNMQLQCTIQDAQIWLTAGDESVQIDLETFKADQA
ncbi:YaeQ family protein [Undibacterium sp. RTI2.1]|uniref:YaeQ family protein n=1 Tax=unclassified Undibacterium TaxID=2630295 RepID=UPI002AB445F9|nr:MULTISPECIES: YaeQ family protein [unclassified Undibacterium]MDY7537192.1 YaeQ family protein [Undibacterium sp. 5I1]MEB0031317.1 YaeQ family protein [Undibacterium sp. RTI2.1]MEB0117686.1 YaeQ family protein [Undibacterium sp. RTI2.2]MEB0231481.1 YaeQ family protein [Undibacterium sp. 10I3]MEB0258988.1 YaeQ family protein [Undibacterium sp. 5I1]